MVFISAHLFCWLLLAIASAVTRGHVFETTSCHSKFVVDTKANVFRIVRQNLTDEVNVGLTIPEGIEGTPCGTGDLCVDYGGLATLVVTTQDHCQRAQWTVQSNLTELKDCVILRGHWYGGGEQYTQPWPIEKQPRLETAYITGDFLQKPGSWYGGVTESYWISSRGIAVAVSDTTPLFLSLIDDDGDGTADQMCLAARREAPFVEATAGLTLDYYVCSADDVRQVHEATLPMFYERPAATPDERMMREPIWCTWAEYKQDVNQTRVMAMAYDIIERGYPYSQIEIDDNWETCYGDAVFNEKFPDPKGMIDNLHALGYRVTLWVHPFINDDCAAFAEPDQLGYFVKDADGNTQLTSWWAGSSAGIIDFSNADAVTWWTQRLVGLQESTGMDSFKFDAGEATWLPDVYTLSADQTLWPNIYTTNYVDAVSSFGGLIEVRSGRRNQHEAVFFRMLDKYSSWSYNNGLKTLVPTLLHFGIVGYPFVLPDLIGGDAYGGRPSDELFVRWTQANAFMPSVQFSLLPWTFGSTANNVSLEMSRLHVEYMPQILQAAQEATQTTAPINRPTWWLCPTLEECLTADQQYLLGDDILVAPITEEGATEKTVVLPPGDWRASTDGVVYTGVGQLVFQNLNLETLLFFTRVSSDKFCKL